MLVCSGALLILRGVGCRALPAGRAEAQGLVMLLSSVMR